MADKKNILPPPINPQKEPVTVAVLSGKLDSLFENVKELVKSTARGTENVLRKEMQDVEKRLSNRIDSVEKNLSQVEKNLSEKIDKIGEKVEGHEARLSAVEEKIETHLTTHP